MIEPGNFLAGTNMFNDKIINRAAESMWNNMTEEVKDAYGKDYFQDRVNIMKGYMDTGIKDLSPVIQVILSKTNMFK